MRLKQYHDPTIKEKLTERIQAITRATARKEKTATIKGLF